MVKWMALRTFTAFFYSIFLFANEVSSSTVMTYCPAQYFISQMLITPSRRSIKRSICTFEFRQEWGNLGSDPGEVLILAVGRDIRQKPPQCSTLEI
jgi:hypothetical protein